MSEIQNNQGANPAGNAPYQNEKTSEHPLGVSFQGDRKIEDLRNDPANFYKRSWVQPRFKANIDGHSVEFGTKEISQVKKDLEQLYKNPSSIQKAVALYPTFQGYAKNKNVSNPDALALALEHYAATNEFVKNAEIEETE